MKPGGQDASERICMPALYLPNTHCVPWCLCTLAVPKDQTHLWQMQAIQTYQYKHAEGLLQDKQVDITSLGGGVCNALHNIPALAQALTSHNFQPVTEMIQTPGIAKAYTNQAETLLYFSHHRAYVVNTAVIYNGFP